MDKTLTTKSSITIDAPATLVWSAIIDPSTIRNFMMGMQAVSSWKVGEELRWLGRHEEKPEDNAKGTIIKMEPGKQLSYTFYYPGYGYADQPEFYNLVNYDLEAIGDKTRITVQQGDFSVFEQGETFVQHSQQFWDQVLINLKELLEKQPSGKDDRL